MNDELAAAPKTATTRDRTKINYVERGNPAGPPVFLGPHCYASSLDGNPPSDIPAFVTQSWVDALADRFRLIVADYPRGTGKTGNALGLDYTAAIAVEDFEAILDAVGVERTGFVGYSYGGAFGVQVACRSDRLSAVAIGGWPPLEAPFRPLAEIVTEIATNPPEEIDRPPEEVLWSAAGFYGSLVDWPERDEVPKIDIPRIAFMGTRDAFGAPGPTLANLFRGAEDDLRALGWEIAWIEGADHPGAMDARISGPVVRAFLERALC